MAVLGQTELLYIKTDNGYLPIGCIVGHSFSEDTDMLDTTTLYDGGWETSTPVRQRANLSFNGLVGDELTSTTKVTFQDLRSMKRNRELVEWKIDRADGFADYGEGYITSIGESAEVDSLITFDANIKVEGEPNNEFYVVYNVYWEFSLEAGATIENEQCFKSNISKIFE